MGKDMILSVAIGGLRSFSGRGGKKPCRVLKVGPEHDPVVKLVVLSFGKVRWDLLLSS